MIDPASIGAVGDGVVDDTRVLQTAFDLAAGEAVTLAGRNYLVSDTLYLPTDTILDGGGARLLSTTGDRPILASAAWARLGPTRGYTRIRNLRLHGRSGGPSEDGLVLFDYWSEVSDVEIVDVGGRGIVLADKDASGSAPGGTLVENRVRRCVVRDCGRSAFWLGDTANGRLTDGELSDCIAMLGRAAIDPAIAIGHAAGWTVRNLHVYGGRPAKALSVHQPFFTSISDLYIEDFVETGLSLTGIQTSVAVTNAHILARNSAPDAVFIVANAHRDFDTPACALSNVSLWHEGRHAIRAIDVQAERISLMANGIGVAGPSRDLVSALPRKEALGRRSHTYPGGEPVTMVIDERAEAGAFEAAYDIVVTGRARDGGLSSRYVGVVHWSRDGRNFTPGIVDLVDVSAPFGFSEAPRLTTRAGAGKVALVLTFDALASGPVQVSIR